MIQESLDRLNTAVQLELVHMESERAFWERKYRALEEYCFRKLIPESVDVFGRITGYDRLCRHDDIGVHLKDPETGGYVLNGFSAKCRKCGLVITDSNGYPPVHVVLQQIDKLVEMAGNVREANTANPKPKRAKK